MLHIDPGEGGVGAGPVTTGGEDDPPHPERIKTDRRAAMRFMAKILLA
jgi:hypothetical protein